jgi:20S proteasome alpha/beta subunit
MRAASIIVMLVSVFGAQAFCEDKGKVEPGPSLHGTINVLVANDRGIVVLADSRLTEITERPDGTLVSRQLPTPHQKVFRIDDRTICAFAGFAAANTPPLPDFLNNIPAMVGRYEDRLRTAGPLSVSDKLQLMQDVFAHYLTGIANR